MILNTDSLKPIYIQVSEWMEAEILNGNIKEGERIYSQYQLADIFNINPATAAKALNILADENIVFKKRGLGMFVSENAKEVILDKRKNQTLRQLVSDLVMEAERLGIDESQLMDMIKQAKKQSREERI